MWQLVLFYDFRPSMMYIFMSTGWEKSITEVLPLDGQEVIQLACFISPENACLGFSV